MLESLDVERIALIENASLTFGPGLTVLSGETGAGKTALISAAKLLIGERADSDTIREGATSATVAGTFEVAGRPVRVERKIDRGGRSRCWLDGTSVKVGELSDKVGPLVDLHGQHDHQQLLSPQSHRGYFDAWASGRIPELSRAYTEAFLVREEAQAKLDAILRARAQGARDVELAAFTISQIEEVDPKEGEYEELERVLPTLEHAEALSGAAESARANLAADGGAADALADAAAALERMAGVDSALDGYAERLEVLVDEARELAGELRLYRDSVEFDPVVLQERMERMSALEGLMKRYGPRMSDVFEHLEDARQTVENHDVSDEGLERARAAVDAAEEHLISCARELSNERDQASDAFAQALTQAVSSLGMGDVSLMASIVDLPREAWTAESPQRIEFLYSPGPGVAPRPLARIASGGELSRVMLALKGSLEEHGADQTLIFDEVDSGIGGATAYLIGQRLRELSTTHQVLVVTHLAQIAAFADAQMVVTKDAAGTGSSERDGIPVTRIRPVEGEERVREIARMLSGRDDEISLEHARTLLAECREGRR